MVSVAYGILLRPLPYPDADRVAMVYMHFSPQNFGKGTMSMADYLDWKSQNHTFEEPSLFSSGRVDLVTTGEPEQLQGARVSAGFFSTLRGRPLLGRIFLPGEDRPGAPSTVVIGESLWRRRFSASPAALGQAIRVNGFFATIIGVMPTPSDSARPNGTLTNLPIVPPTRRGPLFLSWCGTPEARCHDRAGAGGNQHYRPEHHAGESVLSKSHAPHRTAARLDWGDVRTPLVVLIGAVGLVLLIAVVNVANLMLARATTREAEMALRLSLGASRARLIRQLLAESLLLSVAGGAAGLAMSYGGIQILRAWNPGNLPLIGYVQLDGRAFVFMLLTAAATGLLFGLAPALQSLRADLNSTIKEGGRGTAAGAGTGRRARTVLVVGEIALSLMLMVGAGLLLAAWCVWNGLRRFRGSSRGDPHGRRLSQRSQV